MSKLRIQKAGEGFLFGILNFGNSWVNETLDFQNTCAKKVLQSLEEWMEVFCGIKLFQNVGV